jgi:hypothetical protein
MEARRIQCGNMAKANRARVITRAKVTIFVTVGRRLPNDRTNHTFDVRGAGVVLRAPKPTALAY